MMKNINKTEACVAEADRKVLSALLRDGALRLPIPFALWSSGGEVVFNIYEGDTRTGPNVFRSYLVCPIANYDGTSPTPPPTCDPCTWFYYCFDPQRETMEDAAAACVRYVEEKTARKFPGAR